MTDEFKLEPTDDEQEQVFKIFDAAYKRLAEEMTEKHLITVLIASYMERLGLVKMTAFTSEDNVEVYFTEGMKAGFKQPKKTRGRK